jgi:dihydrofolate synthase/folylpolyglutamate synthase
MSDGSRILDKLARSERSGMKLGLERFQLMLDDLEHPERSFPAVLIGGTNGKGSVSAMLARTLEATGYRTGLFTSPHLLSYRERVRVNGRSISRAQIDARMTVMAPSLSARGASFFEAMTALAFLHFQAEQVDIAVLEVGLGGRLDSTNVGDPLVSTVVTVGMDHTRILGRTIEAIAGEKVHIARSGKPFVVGSNGRAGQLLDALARTRGARPVRLGCDARFRTLASGPQGTRLRFEYGGRTLPEVHVSLPGRHQARNAAVAILTAAALDASGFAVPDPARGLDRVAWPGRLQLVEGEPQMLLDGAHNPSGGRALAKYLQSLEPRRKTVCVFGMLGTRSVKQFVRPLLPLIDAWVVTRAPGERGMAPDTIVQSIDAPTTIESDVAVAIERARQLAERDGRVVVTGSLRVVAVGLQSCGRRRLDLI